MNQLPPMWAIIKKELIKLGYPNPDWKKFNIQYETLNNGTIRVRDNIKSETVNLSINEINFADFLIEYGIPSYVEVTERGFWNRVLKEKEICTIHLTYQNRKVILIPGSNVRETIQKTFGSIMLDQCFYDLDDLDENDLVSGFITGKYFGYIKDTLPIVIKEEATKWITQNTFYVENPINPIEYKEGTEFQLKLGVFSDDLKIANLSFTKEAFTTPNIELTKDTLNEWSLKLSSYFKIENDITEETVKFALLSSNGKLSNIIEVNLVLKARVDRFEIQDERVEQNLFSFKIWDHGEKRYLNKEVGELPGSLYGDYVNGNGYVTYNSSEWVFKALQPIIGGITLAVFLNNRTVRIDKKIKIPENAILITDATHDLKDSIITVSNTVSINGTHPTHVNLIQPFIKTMGVLGDNKIPIHYEYDSVTGKLLYLFNVINPSSSTPTKTYQMDFNIEVGGTNKFISNTLTETVNKDRIQFTLLKETVSVFGAILYYRLNSELGNHFSSVKVEVLSGTDVSCIFEESTQTLILEYKIPMAFGTWKVIDTKLGLLIGNTYHETLPIKEKVYLSNPVDVKKINCFIFGDYLYGYYQVKYLNGCFPDSFLRKSDIKLSKNIIPGTIKFTEEMYNPQTGVYSFKLPCTVDRSRSMFYYLEFDYICDGIDESTLKIKEDINSTNGTYTMINKMFFKSKETFVLSLSIKNPNNEVFQQSQISPQFKALNRNNNRPVYLNSGVFNDKTQILELEFKTTDILNTNNEINLNGYINVGIFYIPYICSVTVPKIICVNEGSHITNGALISVYQLNYIDGSTPYFVNPIMNPNTKVTKQNYNPADGKLTLISDGADLNNVGQITGNVSVDDLNHFIDLK